MIEAKQDPRRRKRISLSFLLPICCCLAVLYGLLTGSVFISVQQVWNALLHSVESLESQIIWDIRLPRIITGLLVGACLAISGALLQGVMRNPLADPGIIGVSSGAGLAAVITMLIFPQYIHLLPLGAFMGALAATVLIYFVAWDRGVSPVRMILAGIAMNALLGAAMSAIMILYSDRVQAVLPWLVGGLGGRGWTHVSAIVPYALIGMIASVFAVKQANLLLLGDEVAGLLGTQVQRSRMFLILLAAFLAGAGISVAGLLGFVGLIVPHLVRLMVGNDYRYLLPLSAVGGACLVVLSDTAARSWFDPIELPVGILLSALGAPFFLYLLRGGMKGWRAS